MSSGEPREPINWREDLRDLFYAEAAIIMREVFDEIRDALRTGSTNTSRLVDPEIARLRAELFDDYDEMPVSFTNDERSMDAPQ